MVLVAIYLDEMLVSYAAMIYRKSAWDTRLTSTLVGLAPPLKPGFSQKCRKITDPRFISNGFDIRIESETDRALLFGVCSSVISFMGVNDVHEVLKYIMGNQDVSIEDCRPEKVKTVWY